MFSISTGEPPTPPSGSSGSDDIMLLLESTNLDSTEKERSQSLTAQDSGYEASPCSIADNTSGDLHFFGDDSNQTSRRPLSSSGDGRWTTSEVVDDVFEDCASNFLLLEQESDVCEECGSGSPCTCSRAESAATVRVTPDHEGDLSNCDNSSNSSEQSSSPRPSSLPIQIPGNDAHSWTNIGQSPRIDLPLQETRPLARSPRGNLQTFISRVHPRSWPSSVVSWMNPVAPGSPSSSMAVHPAFNMFRVSLTINTDEGRNRNIPRLVEDCFRTMEERGHLQEQQRLRIEGRSRRRRSSIDSDASSEDFCDEELADTEVFAMAEDDTSPTPRVSPLEPLPDIILSSPSAVRRNRSLSVNLPPQEPSPAVLRSIGRNLRRLSDQFESRREQTHLTRRRQTMDGNMYYRSN